MNYKYVSIDRVFSKIARDLDESNIVEADIIEWAGEALEFIGAAKMYEEAVAFIEVKNHQCELPAGLHAVVQVARNRCWSPKPDDNTLCPKAIIESKAQENLFVQGEPGCNTCTPTVNGQATKPDYIVLDCNGQPINDYEVAYYRPYFDMRYEYFGWCNSLYYRQCYVPVRLTTNSFFNSIVCQEENAQSIYQSSIDEYTIVQGSILRFNFKEGSVAVSYLRQVIDEETGYPMIPDNVSYVTAITKYITMKIMEKQFYAGREGAERRMGKAEQDWHWYCKQAGNVDMMPFGVDEHQNLLDQRSYLLPRQNRYFGFFGKMARPETRKFDDPDRRNWYGYYFRGN